MPPEHLQCRHPEDTPMAKRLREALEAALRENPDDLAAHMAWADHAAESGDPRGEFAQVQIALEDPSRSPAERKELEARETELLQRHLDDWLGPTMALLFDLDGAEAKEEFGLEYYLPDRSFYRFARGWLDAVHLDTINPAVVEAVGRCPTAGLLRSFGFDRDDYEDPGTPALPSLPFLGRLRHFQIGQESDSTRGEGLPAAVARMTRLEELEVYAKSRDLQGLFSLPLSRLRKFVAYHLRTYPLDVLGGNPAMANLVTLDCFPHMLEPGDDEAYLNERTFVPFAHSPHLKSLTHLTLQAHEIGDAGVVALVESGMLRRLQTLELWSGNITDVGARALASSGQLAGLKKLRLTDNYLTDEGIALLRATGVPLEAERMHDARALEGREHLWHGDME
jgi:uncharacterized protein (TIGR02996 family)